VSIISRNLQKQIGRLNSQTVISIAEIELARSGPPTPRGDDVMIESVPRLNMKRGDFMLETGSYVIESDQDSKEASNFDRHNFALQYQSVGRKAEESKSKEEQ